METWKDIPGYGGFQVSDCGRIRSLTKTINGKLGSKRKIPGKIRKLQVDGLGYCSVMLNFGKRGNYKHCNVHRLVLLAFVGDCPSGFQAHHIDHNPSNNNLSNLAYVTPKENVGYSIKNGTHVNPKSPMIPVSQYCLTGEFVRKYKSGKEAMDVTGIDKRHICCACKGKYQTAGGFVWRYSS